MNKITLKIEDIIKTHQTLNKVLTLQGIPRNKNYWFDRNKKFLESHVKHWFGVEQKVVLDKYIIDIPATPFIPPEKYAEFKKEIEEAINTYNKPIVVEEIFAKYETKSNASKGIPVEKRAAFEKEIGEVAAKCEKEIEFQEILVDQPLEMILKSLSGDEQLLISYMLKDMSPLELFPKGIQ